MRALVCHGIHDYRFEEMPSPCPGPGEIVARVLACGICASDVKCYLGEDNFWAGDPPFVRPPFVPGHEFIAEVAELGPDAVGATPFQVGDRVVSEQIIPCGECRFCRSGDYWMCEVHDIYGFRGGRANGAMAEYITFSPRARNYRVPPEVSVETGALIEPLSCAIHAVERAGARLNDVVVLAGAGTLGLLMLQVTKLRSPARMLVVDPRDNRRQLALRLGADQALDPGTDDIAAIVRKASGGYGCDLYLEASGSPESINTGLAVTRKLGRFLQFGITASKTTADWNIIGDQKELTILGSHLSPNAYPTAIRLLSQGLVRTDEIVTHSFPLDQYQTAFDQVQHPDAQDVIKALIKP